VYFADNADVLTWSQSTATKKFIYTNMKKLILLISITIFGWAGWWLGANIGIMTAYVISVISSLLGVYVAVRINQNYLS